MHVRLVPLACLAALALAGCAEQSGPAASRNRIYSVDLSGKAAECTAPAVKLTAGQPVTATIATSGGGWCGIPVTLSGDALTAGLITQPPSKGRVYVHTVGDETRVDYTPTAAATADAFAVQFLPGDEMMRVTVSAAAGAHK